jgi:hypothetical protein
VQRHGTNFTLQEEQMAERDRFRNDERWSRDDDWRREGGSYRSGSEARRGFGEGNEDYYRSRDFGSRGEFGRGEFGRSDYGRSDYGQGRGDFGRDYGRGRDYGSSFGDQSFGGGDYGRDFGRGDFGRSDWNRSSDWNRPDFDRPEAGRWTGSESWRDQRGTYGGLGYGGSRSSFGRYGEGSFGPYGQGSGQYGRDYGSRYGSDFGRSDYQNRGYQNRGDDDRGFIERVGEAVSSWFGTDEGQHRHHRGRGPKGYARSDDRIREDVSDRLGDDWLVDATEIEVAVLNGEVTLSGTVDGREQRRRAEDIAESVSGVKHVQNNIRVSGTTTAGFGNEPGTTSSSSSAASGTYGSSGTSRKTGSSS